ncbi:MAG: aminodeoxychorismate/anthranilate synthase component II [Planctomycetota bacterium]
MSRILLIDNYDSFTFNLVDYLAPWRDSLVVRRNDEVSVSEMKDMGVSALIVSPGPGTPGQSGVTPEAVAWAAESGTPYLGVCLGHQALGQHFGWNLGPALAIVHGKASAIRHDGEGIYRDLPGELQVGRYHSLSLRHKLECQDLLVTARTSDGEVMGVRHRCLPMEGIQFHPESILTPWGKTMLANFMKGLKST